MAQTLLLGLGVALAIEGAAYAAAPGMMQQLAARVGVSAPGELRIAGLIALALGVALVAVVR